MTQPVPSGRLAPLLATAFALLFVISMVLVQAGQASTGFFRYTISNQGIYSVGAVLGMLSGLAMIGVAGLADGRLLSRFGCFAAGAAGSLVVTLNAVRTVAPQYDFDTREPYAQAVDTTITGLMTAALLITGVVLLDGVVRGRGLAMGIAAIGSASLIIGVLIAAMLNAVDRSTAFGVTVASLGIGLVCTALWGLVASAARAPAPTWRR